MEWWEILLAVALAGLWLYIMIKELIVNTIINNRKYKERYRRWSETHPDLIRIECKNCKYCISETEYTDYYPRGVRKRRPVYCTLLKRNLKQNSFCLMAEPISECYKKREGRSRFSK